MSVKSESGWTVGNPMEKDFNPYERISSGFMRRLRVRTLDTRVKRNVSDLGVVSFGGVQKLKL